jgi:chaperonin cofactor prefoldin
LGALEQGQQQKGFMDKYGTKFSGDEGIGVNILAELSRRGIDTGAADEAVQEILDQIRQEATTILDKIKMDETSVSDLMDKVSSIEEGVQAATGAAPEMPAPDMAAPPDAGGMPPEGAPPMEDPNAMPPPDAGAPPPPDAGAPPPDAGAEAPPPPPDAGLPPDQTLSDENMKDIVDEGTSDESGEDYTLDELKEMKEALEAKIAEMEGASHESDSIAEDKGGEPAKDEGFSFGVDEDSGDDHKAEEGTGKEPENESNEIAKILSGLKM